jgi:hypothetical protein
MQELEREVSLLGGEPVDCDDKDPNLKNAFLKNIIAFEEADKEPARPLRSLFPDDFEFPPVSSLSAGQIAGKLREIASVLSMNNIELSFANPLPDAVMYKYLAEECIPHETVSAAVEAGFTLNLDGCDGGCDSCFQKEYCETAKRMLEDGHPGEPPG